MVDGYQLLNEKIDSLKSDLKDDIQDIKRMIEDHLKHCDKNMEGCEIRIRALEAYKNKLVGVLIGVSAIAGFASGIIILAIDKFWR